MESPRIIFVGGQKSQPMVDALCKKYSVTFVSSGAQALKQINHKHKELFIVDSSALRTGGNRILAKLRREFPHHPIIRIVDEDPCTTDVDICLVLPFTVRKLSNAIERLVRPGAEKGLEVGPFIIDVKNRILIAHGAEVVMNPKQATLMALFMNHPRETISRERIMLEVWDTEYTGDTRTLDVHIRWIRQVIEASSVPQYLITVRGVGYRLEV
ncbi:response regulator transcription factor [Anaerolineales bacterium]